MRALPKAMRATCAGGFALVAVLALAGLPARAQERIRPGEGAMATVSRPVVQPLPAQDSLRLNAALSRLGRDPRDLEALLDAGNAALSLGDVDAASGFFRRADQVSSKDPRVKAGLAGAMVRSGNPLGAIPLFDEAEKAGALPGTIASDRGLAYDLVGDNVTAQRLYRLALQRGPDAEVTRRLALSQAIAGDKRGTEATLLPLLRDQDKSAWRTRTFALAILGQSEEAIRTAKTILPEDLAESMAPYLRYMPQLTPAQQAAAANLGSFPRASEIGRDDPRFAQYAAAAAPKVAAATAAAPTPTLSRSARAAQAREKAREQAREQAQEQARAESRRQARGSSSSSARAAPPVPQPGREIAPRPGETAAALIAAAPPATASTSMSAPVGASAVPSVPPLAAIASGQKPTPPAAPVVTSPSVAPRARPSVAFTPPLPSGAPAAARPAATLAPTAAAAPARAVPPARTSAQPARPGFDLAQLPRSVETPAPAVTPAPTPAPVAATPAPAAAVAAAPVAPAPAPPAAAPRISLAEAFGDLGKPSTAAAASAGAVDISRFTPARPKADPAKTPPAKATPAKPAPPSHPSRIWVQLGVGRDKAALALDWKKLLKQAPAAFKGRKPYVSDMGRTNRMLTGPFDTAAQANKFVAELRAAKVTDTMVWTSPAGQVVDSIASR